MSHSRKCWEERESLNDGLDESSQNTAEMTKDGDQGF